MTWKVTALTPQQKNKDRVNVYLDNKFAFGLAAIIAARLKVGQTLGDGEIAHLRGLDEVEEAYNKSLKYLSYRPRSRSELERYLNGKKLPAEAIAKVIARLEQAQFVNDGEFARFWVENREHFAPRGKRALRTELRQKGLSDADVETALSEVDETASAYEAGRKRAARMHGLDRETFHRRLSGFLQRRGFGYEVTKTVVARLWKEQGGDAVESDFD